MTRTIILHCEPRASQEMALEALRAEIESKLWSALGRRKPADRTTATARDVREALCA